MKPIDLTPTGSAAEAVAVSTSAGPSRQLIGLSVIGVLAVVAVGGYFAMAQVNSVNEETKQINADTEGLREQHKIVTTQLAEAGQKPAEQGWDTVVASYTTDVVEKIKKRSDFTRLMRDLRRVLVSGSWFTSVKSGSDAAAASSTSGSDDAPTTITFEGYARSTRDVMTIIANLNATQSIEGAKPTLIERQVSNKKKVFRKFTIVATLSLTEAATSGASGLVSDTGGADELSLNSSPPKKKGSTTSGAPEADAVIEKTSLEGLVSDTSGGGAE